MVDRRTMLVTGVSSGLGAAFAREGLAAGYRVVGTVRRAQDAAAFTAATGAPALMLDLDDAASAQQVIVEVTALLDSIDVLVNNAGFGHEGAIEESPLDALRRQLDVNVVGQVAMIQAVLPSMRARRHGHIVNVTSMAGTVGLPGVGFYCAAKFAMEGLTEALAKEVRPLGIHVTAFAPGQFRTDWAGRSMERAPRRFADYDAIIDPLRENRRVRDGSQPGDPAKAAVVLIDLLEAASPPTRLYVGGDAVMLAEQKLKRAGAEISAWSVASRSTDFAPASDRR